MRYSKLGAMSAAAWIVAGGWWTTAGAQDTVESLRQQLRQAQEELGGMRERMDAWLLSAAEREDAIKVELQQRDVEIEALDARARSQAADLKTERETNESIRVELEQARQDATQTESTHGRDLESVRAEVGVLSNTLTQAQAATATATRALETARRDLEAARREAAEREQHLESTTAALDQQRQLTQSLEAGLKELEHRLLASEETALDLDARLANVTDDRNSHLSRAGQAEGRLSELTAEHVDARQQLTNSRAELVRVRPFIHPRDGGSATTDGARSLAGIAARRYAQLLSTRTDEDGTTETAEENIEAARALVFARQLLVADLMTARGLYQVEPEDTLSRVAARFLGEAGRWPDIFESNSHVLNSADALVPGTTLVIP